MPVPNPTTPEPTPDPRQDAISRTMYAELRDIAHRVFAGERSGHTLQPTAVVNEACMRLISSGVPDLPREQQLAIGARVLRQVLIDYARAHTADKRGGGSTSARLDIERDIVADHATTIDLDAIHRAIERLRALSARQAEVVTLRIYGGLTMDQVATVMGTSKRTAEGDWTVARAWLRRELARAEPV